MSVPCVTVTIVGGGVGWPPSVFRPGFQGIRTGRGGHRPQQRQRRRASGLQLVTTSLQAVRGLTDLEQVVERLAQEEPDVHAQYLTPQFDGPKFKAEQPKEYEKYMDTPPVRVFEFCGES